MALEHVTHCFYIPPTAQQGKVRSWSKCVLFRTAQYLY